MANSILDETKALIISVYHNFTTNPNDQISPIFADPEAGNIDDGEATRTVIRNTVGFGDFNSGNDQADKSLNQGHFSKATAGLIYGVTTTSTSFQSIALMTISG